MNRFAQQPKSFAWSYSRLKTFRICPRKYDHEINIKDIVSPRSAELDEGDAVHGAFQRRVEKGTPMPTAYTHLSDWGDEAARIIHPKQKTFCEKELAITREHQPSDWFARDTWYRSKIDNLKIFPWKKADAWAALCIDFKTGAPKNDIVQLALYADIIFAHWPLIQVVRTEYWWTKVKDKSVEFFKREDMPQLWDTLLPELSAMEQAYIKQEYPARKNGLCGQWCGVTSCEFNGRKNNG